MALGHINLGGRRMPWGLLTKMCVVRHGQLKSWLSGLDNGSGVIKK